MSQAIINFFAFLPDWLEVYIIQPSRLLNSEVRFHGEPWCCICLIYRFFCYPGLEALFRRLLYCCFYRRS